MTSGMEKLERLCEAAVEERLTRPEREELETMLLGDGAALDFYVDRLLDHAMLCAQGEEEGLDVEEMRLLLGMEPDDVGSRAGEPDCRTAAKVAALRRHGTFPETASSNRFFERKKFPAVAAAVLLLSFLVSSSFYLLRGKNDHFASITRTTNCLWADSLTKTSPGTRLGRCTLQLEEGIALVHFDCGLAVSIEGPCVFEIKGRKHAVLHSGRLVAAAESLDGRGFVVDTPQGSIRDLGTKFAVYVPENNPANVYVLDGSVEVLPKEASRPIQLSKGGSLFLGDTDPAAPETASERENDIIQISSAMNRGKEAWVVVHWETAMSAERLFPLGITEPFMLVKLSCPGDERADRKAIFSIDLSTLKPEEKSSFDAVSLCLSYGPTELGYASGVPDSTFTVYGLVDESHDDWNEKTIDWAGFPGNAGRNRLDSAFWKPLGTFSIKQGSRSGTVQVNGETIKEFIRRDTNDLLTFAIVRDTAATESQGLVHGFANRHHPTLMPPRLIFHLNGTRKSDTE